MDRRIGRGDISCADLAACALRGETGFASSGRPASIFCLCGAKITPGTVRIVVDRMLRVSEFFVNGGEKCTRDGGAFR